MAKRGSLRKNFRWKATINYRLEHGPSARQMFLEELSQLHDEVERGPHWDTIIGIEIERVNHITSQSLTVEKAATI